MDGPPTKKTKRSSHGNNLSNPPARPYMFVIPSATSDEVNSSLEVFLSDNAPSKITKQQTPWIRVFKINEEKEEDSYGREAVGNIIEDWRSMADKDLAKIHNMAEKYQMTTGKWMIFVPTGGVDEIWGQIVRGLAEGLLGDHVCGAKESEICYFNYNFMSGGSFWWPLPYPANLCRQPELP